MTVTPGELRTTNDLRQFIHETLCEKESLVLGQFRLSEMELTKRGRFCGIQFLLHGPRSVRLGAVWAAETNVIYLYDASGRRFEKVRLRQQITVSGKSAA